MKISVVIATKDRPSLLTECLNSIISNRFGSYEIIIVDLSSGNNTKKTLKKFKETKYIRMPLTSKAQALNFAIAKTKGEILAFTDDDCLVSRDWLSGIWKEFEGTEQNFAVAGRALKQSKKGEICSRTIFRQPLRRKIYLKPRLVYHFSSELLIGSNMAIPKKIFQKIGGINEEFSPGALFKSAEDTDLGYRLLKNKIPIVYLPNITVCDQSWRTPQQDIENKYAYGYGKAGFYIKYFLGGDTRMIMGVPLCFGFHLFFMLLAVLCFQKNNILGHFSYLRGMIIGGIRMLQFQGQRK